MSFSKQFLECAAGTIDALDATQMDALAEALAGLREDGGRLFILGVGGSAANASHAVNDFRKLCRIEAYAPTDNVSELTARTNDEGFDTVFTGFLEISRARAGDALLIFSVGGGDRERNISTGLIAAIDLAAARGMKVYGIVGRAQGYTAEKADLALVVPQSDPALVTPITEAFQAVIWHGLVSHPALQVNATKW